MNWIGPQIEAVRKRRGWTREVLGVKLGVTSQTVFNLERVPDHNLTTNMMKRLEQVLHACFTISLTEEETRMSMTRITMGNDEFILFIRKSNRDCTLGNKVLGRRIWEWLRDNDPTAKIVQEDAPAYWGDNGTFISEFGLPKTAAQFEFDPVVLVRLYDFLMTLCSALPTPVPRHP